MFTLLFLGPTLADAVIIACDEQNWDVSVDMDVVEQLYPGSKTSSIYLGEDTCPGVVNGSLLVFQQGLRECFTSERVTFFFRLRSLFCVA